MNQPNQNKPNQTVNISRLFLYGKSKLRQKSNKMGIQIESKNPLVQLQIMWILPKQQMNALTGEKKKKKKKKKTPQLKRERENSCLMSDANGSLVVDDGAILSLQRWRWVKSLECSSPEWTTLIKLCERRNGQGSREINQIRVGFYYFLKRQCVSKLF